LMVGSAAWRGQRIAGIAMSVRGRSQSRVSSRRAESFATYKQEGADEKRTAEKGLERERNELR
jgi:hypothetical protein